MNISPSNKLIFYIRKTVNTEVYDQLAAGQYSVCSLTKDIITLILSAALIATSSLIFGGLVLYILLHYLMLVFLIVGVFIGFEQIMFGIIEGFANIVNSTDGQSLYRSGNNLSFGLLIWLGLMVLHATGYIKLCSSLTINLVERFKNLFRRNKTEYKESFASKLIASIKEDIKNKTCSVVSMSSCTNLSEIFKNNGCVTSGEFEYAKAHYYNSRQYNQIELWEFTGFSSLEDFKEMKKTIK